MDRQVQAHELHKVGILETEHVGKVGRPVLGGIDGSNNAILERVAINLCSDGGELGNQVQAVLECVIPVMSLRGQIGVGETRWCCTLFIPAAYAMANLLSVCMAETAETSWLMGWTCWGKLAIKSVTCLGTLAREARSLIICEYSK